MDMIKDLKRPIWQLTIEEFLELINTVDKPIVKDTVNTDTKYAYGISGIANVFGCSKKTAGLIKKSGVIDKAITQIGRKITIDIQMALELNKQPKPKNRR
jgi:Protein of unknown function (DUF3853)